MALDKTWPETDNTDTGTSLHSSAPSSLPVNQVSLGKIPEQQEASSAPAIKVPVIQAWEDLSRTDSRQCGARVTTTLARLHHCSHLKQALLPRDLEFCTRVCTGNRWLLSSWNRPEIFELKQRLFERRNLKWVRYKLPKLNTTWFSIRQNSAKFQHQDDQWKYSKGFSFAHFDVVVCAQLHWKLEAALPQHLHHFSHRMGASVAGPWTQHGWSNSPIRTVSALKVLKSQWRGIFRDIIHQTHITAHALTHTHTVQKGRWDFLFPVR